jgi:hypothetical protein
MVAMHSPFGQSPAFHNQGPDSVPGHSMWDFWWTKWHWDIFLSESFGFPLSVLFHRCSIFTHESSGGWTKGLLEAQFHRDTIAPHRNNNNTHHNRMLQMLLDADIHK